MKSKILCFFLSFFIVFDIILAKDLDVLSDKYILYNMSNNSILIEEKSNEETYIASLTKIMSVIVSIENIKDYDKEIKITSKMIDDIASDVSVTGFKVGEVVTINDLLYAAILDSGADAIQALELTVSKSKKEFVDLMNKKVKELGLLHTYFENAIGLTDKDNYSSAYDVSQILIYALKNEKFKSVFTTKSYVLTNGKEIKSTIEYYSKSTNYDLSYITGAKTGYTSASGYCLATTATISDVDYLLVTLNADKKNPKSTHVKDAITVYDYFKDNYGIHNYVDKDDIVVKLKTSDSKEKYVNVRSGVIKSFYSYNDFNKEDVVYEYNGVETISYFTKKGTNIGKISVLYKDEKIGEFDLIYNEELNFGLFNFIKKRFYIFIILGFLIAIFRKK